MELFVRFFNGLSDFDVDILINGRVLTQELKSGDFSPFWKADEGAYEVEIKVEGEVVFEDLVNLLSQNIYTIAIAGDADAASIAILPSELANARMPNITFVNLIPFDSVADVDLNNRMRVQALSFKEISEPIELNAGPHQIDIFNHEDSSRIFSHNLQVSPAERYFAILLPDSMALSSDWPVI